MRSVVIGAFVALVLPLMSCTNELLRTSEAESLFRQFPSEAVPAYGALVVGPPIARHTADPILHDLRSLPAWPCDRDFTEDEWRQYIELARVFQELPPYMVEQLLFAYSFWSGPDDLFFTTWSSEGDRFYEAQSKALILLRVMFELPGPGWSVTRTWDERLNYMPTQNGGIPCKATPGNEALVQGGLASPLRWRDGHPELICRREASSGRGHYEPGTEFRYFLLRFPYRQLPK